MSEPKSIEEVPNWVIVNALRCPIEAQISIVAKLLQHLDREQRNQALSMSGVVGRSELLLAFLDYADPVYWGENECTDRRQLIDEFLKSKQ